jgi:hypothetical protein
MSADLDKFNEILPIFYRQSTALGLAIAARYYLHREKGISPYEALLAAFTENGVELPLTASMEVAVEEYNDIMAGEAVYKATIEEN